MRLLKYIMIAAAWTAGIAAHAQERLANGLEVDRTVHNFGDIMLGSGPVSCTFTFTNKGDKPAAIYNVVTTCGCTGTEWTKEPIRPGMTGKISVTYSNDEGPYPFDKNLTVYLSDVKKPLILKFRGISHQKERPLEEIYTVKYGPLALRDSQFKCGNLEQGGSKSEAVMVANLSDKPLMVRFDNVTEELDIRLSPNPIPPRSTAEMSFTVKASREKWGKNWYWATPVAGGKTYKNSDGDNRIGIWAFTKENFGHLTEQEKAAGPKPMFGSSTFNFSKIRQGTVVNAEFTLTNDGKKPLCIYKVDSDAAGWSYDPVREVAPGQKAKLRVSIDTADMPKGESMTVVTLTTNSPLRPVINLFVAGYIE